MVRAVLLLLPVASVASGQSAGELVAGNDQTCFRAARTPWVCWGSMPHENFVGPNDAGDARGRPKPLVLARPIAPGPLALGHAHACTLAERSVLCWGSNQFGQAGGPRLGRRSADVTSPVAAWNGRATAIAAGYDYTCAALPEGVECTGGSRFDSAAVMIAGMPGGITRLYANDEMVCALVNDAPACFGRTVGGYDFVRRAGGTSTSHQRERIDYPAFPGPVTAFAIGGGGVGPGHLCGIVAGEVWCGGDNFSGQTTQPHHMPLLRMPDSSYALQFSWNKVPLPASASAIAAGGVHTCAVVGSARAVWCWGGNRFAQTGAPVSDHPVPPHEVPGLRDVSAVAVAGQHSCAVSATGVWCWGSDEFLQLGQDAPKSCTYPQGRADTGPAERLSCSGRPLRVPLPR